MIQKIIQKLSLPIFKAHNECIIVTNHFGLFRAIIRAHNLPKLTSIPETYTKHWMVIMFYLDCVPQEYLAALGSNPDLNAALTPDLKTRLMSKAQKMNEVWCWR